MGAKKGLLSTEAENKARAPSNFLSLKSLWKDRRVAVGWWYVLFLNIYESF